MGDTSPERKAERPSEIQRLLAEFVGTFFLVLAAAGADVIWVASGGKIAHTSRYLAPGFVVTAMIWSTSAVSGSHINPAVTFAFVVRRCFPLTRAFGYWAAQFAGGFAAAGLLRWIFGSLISVGASHPGQGITPLTAMLWEAVLTTLLVLVILGTAQNEAVVGKNVALAVGLTVAACGLFSSTVSGASMNPARSIAPQVVAGLDNLCWIYIVGPLAGALVAASLAYALYGPPRPSEEEAAHGKHEHHE